MKEKMRASAADAMNKAEAFDNTSMQELFILIFVLYR